MNPAHHKKRTKGFLGRIAGALSARKAAVVSSDFQSGLDNLIAISNSNTHSDLITQHERILLSNILKLRDITVVNVMVPRAEIIAIDVSLSYNDLVALLAEKHFSRFPVFEGNLDHILGSVHIKDLLGPLAQHNHIDLRSYLSDIFFVSPAMPILDLILAMRKNRRHMALVVDEYGGIDGLVTINDVIESIVGEIEDEHDTNDPKIYQDKDGAIIADTRLYIEEFEREFGTHILNASEREEAETLGGLLFLIAKRIPARGEIISHKSGMGFEIVEADPRRVYRVRLRDIPPPVV